MTLPVQGTDLYVIDPDTGELIDAGCITSIDGVDSAVTEITVSCINRRSDQKVPGNITPGSVTFGLNFDPSDAGHVRLHQLKTKRAQLQWAIGLSDGPQNDLGESTSPPTVDSAGDFNLPADRSWITFPGFMTSFPFSFSGGNAVVSSNIGISLSDDPVIVPKSA